jgi:hypothetical protein
MESATPKYWMGDVPLRDDFGMEITDEFIDGVTRQGPWAMMAPTSWRTMGIGVLGVGRGQRYQKQKNGIWLKVEG